MKTPWRATYDAGERIHTTLSEKGIRSNRIIRIIGLFYFVAVAVMVFGSAALIRWVAPDSSLSRFVGARLDAIFYLALGAFIFYVIGLTFWQAFFPPNEASDERNNG